MNNEFNGYVIYSEDDNKQIPFAVVSDNYDCKAIVESIPTQFKNFLIQIEDRRFYDHNGIDIRSLLRAIIKNIKAGKIVQGGSTISQQLAKNLLKDNRKSLLRKFREVIRAFQIEKKYSKDEILNFYFNNVYFGKNIWGIRTAGLYYFGKEFERLSQPEILYLLTLLRGPNYYVKRPDIAALRYKCLNQILLEKNLLSKNRIKKNLNTTFLLQENKLQTIKNISIPYLIESTNTKNKIIVSTIDLKIQSFTKQFVLSSKYLFQS